MFSFQNALITFALVLAATDFSYGQWYGPDGIRPIRPLGPGGVQPLRPLGPGGVQPIRPLGPGGVQPLKPLGPGGIRKSSKSLALLILIYAIFILLFNNDHAI